MATFISHSPEETFALGERWGRLAQAGWVVALQGDLGAGKTQLVKGFACGLGIAARVVSPTFALIHQHHSGRLPLVHLDLYRLETRAQIVNAGLDEHLFSPPGATVVEWPERWLSGGAVVPMPAGWRWVQILQTGESERNITYEGIES